MAFDREAIVRYKRALDAVIARDLKKTEGLSTREAVRKAKSFSACVYSSNQEDAKPSEDKVSNRLRQHLLRYYLDHEAEKKAKEEFEKKDKTPYFLIVCNKLLTGFDAPIEGVMYLDNPLSEHNLLQAIARTNRVWSGGKKESGLIVDYIGVTKKLDDALSSYRAEDVKHALRDAEELVNALRAAHNEAMSYLGEIKAKRHYDRDQFMELIQKIDGIDGWYIFKRRLKSFTKAYETLSPDPRVLDYQSDLKWMIAFSQFASLEFENKESFDLEDVSGKIRSMLEEYLEVTGVATLCK
ncbi:MAG: type I restriction endonuclease subunit R, partial [Pedobacter sp.]